MRYFLYFVLVVMVSVAAGIGIAGFQEIGRASCRERV
jgi:hypothetical protein